MRHNVRTRLFLGGRWVDVTDKVYQRDPIEISRGRTDETGETPPQTCSLTLDNRSGDFSMRNPMGQWYGALNRNVPLEMAYSVTTDVFDRALVNSWGNDDNGNAWSLAVTGNVPVPSGADFEVSGGVGKVRLPAGDSFRRVYLNDVQFTDVDVTTSFTTPTANITGGSVFPGNLGIRGMTGTSNYIYASVEIDTAENIRVGIVATDGTVYATSIDTGIDHAAGQNISVRLQAEGSTARVKVWVTSAGEPLEWTTTSTVPVPVRSGFVAIRTTSAVGNTNPNITFSYDNFRVDSMRFSGEVANWPSGSDVSNKDRYVSIEAAGILRRLGQGNSPQRSTMREGIPGLFGTDLIAYWPCEDGKASTSIASAFSGHPAMTLTDRPDFAEYDELVSSEPLPLVRGSTWAADVPSYTLAGALDVRFIVTIPEGGYASDVSLIEIQTEGTAFRISLSYTADTGSGAGAGLSIIDRTGTLIYSAPLPAFDTDGKRMFWWMRFGQNGSSLDATWGYLDYDDEDGVGLNVMATIANLTIGRATKVIVNPGHSSLMNESAFGHIWIRNNGVALGTPAVNLFHAYRGELALDRMARLCEGNGIPFTYTESEPDDTVQMGPQRVDTLLNQIRECAVSDGGTLHEPSGVLGIAYRTRQSVYGQVSALTLDVSANEVSAPFQPVEDDQQTRNDVEVKNVNGSSARATLETGRMSVQPYPNGIDRYDSRVDINVYPDSVLPDHAWWRVALGTVDEARYPDLSIDLDANPELIPGVLGLAIDDPVHIVNASAVGIYDTIKQLVRGYSERWTNHRGVFRINATPYAPYDVAVLDDGNMRLDSGSSTLTSGYSSSATSISVTSTAERWTTSAGDFPFDIIVSGEAMTVTNITGSSSPQTFTVTRSVNGVVKSQTAGAEVHVLNSFRIGL